MALYFSSILLPFSKKQPLLSSSSIPHFHPIRCLSTTASSTSSSPARRTANYQPTLWADSYIQSLSIDFMEVKYVDRRDKLKEKVRRLIGNQHGIIEQLELVDVLCQLGLDYHFDSEIKDLLSSISSSMENNINNLIENNNLHGSALLFRLLRQHGINDASILRDDALVSCFKKERGSFNPNQQHDIKGILSFYEASYLAMEGEEELYEAGKIAMEHLRYLDKSLLSPQLVEKINHALEIPLHWRMPRLHTRWFIDAYGRQENVNPTLLELAKLDFNMVQSIYKIELQEMSRWRIDVDQQLPNYMKICLNAHFNTINDIATSFTMGKELDILPCLKRVWADLCNAYLIEAKWYHSGYTPTLNEYLENAWVTISGICILITTYCLSDDLNIEALNSLEFYPPIVRHSCMLFRLYDDLGTATGEIQRGDVSKSIQCYMKEKNVSESVARDHIKSLIRNYWKKLNREHTIFSKSLKSFRKALIDVPRTAQFFYQYGDGYGESHLQTKDQILSIAIEPILL